MRDDYQRQLRLGGVAMRLGIEDEEELTKMARFYHTYAPSAAMAKDGMERAMSGMHQASLAMRMIP